MEHSKPRFLGKVGFVAIGIQKDRYQTAFFRLFSLYTLPEICYHKEHKAETSDLKKAQLYGRLHTMYSKTTASESME